MTSTRLFRPLAFSAAIFYGCIAQSQGIAVRSISLDEMADRIAIKELVDAYAHDADRRDSAAQANLFMPDGSIENYEGEPSATNQPKAILKGRAALKSGFAFLKKYETTMHFNGQTDIAVRGDSATGETYCLAHQIWWVNKDRILMIIGIRYYDTFVKQDGRWFFGKRKLIFDWIDRKPSRTRKPGE
jgi:hypothetical protein